MPRILGMHGNSLATYPPSRPVLRGRGVSNGSLLPNQQTLGHQSIHIGRNNYVKHFVTIRTTRLCYNENSK